MSINEILGTLPSGAVTSLSDDQMTQYLRENYIDSGEEKKRRAITRKRIDLYKDEGEKHFEALIDDKFKNMSNREQRKKFIGIAMYQNLTRRIVREISAVYSQAAKRTVKSEPMNARYSALQRTLRMDKRLRLANQMVNLCNEAVVWFDIKRTGKPVIRVVTPDNFWAVCHPNDPTELVAFIFDRHPTAGSKVSPSTPRYIVVTETEHFALNESSRMIQGSRMLHGLSRMPAILVHRTEPDTKLLDASPGKDITAAHEALALMNIMLLKHQKSGTKQAVATGDLGEIPRNQQMDEESILEAPDGVVLSTLDLGANPESYITTARSIIKQIAANYGIPESVFDLSYSASSGYEIELKRESLNEIRSDQILDWRPVEFELTEIMVETLAEAGHPLAFNALGWSVDFGETGAPREPLQMLMYWKELRSMGLMNTIEMYLELNPEATQDDAIDAIASNALIEAERVAMFRELNISPDTPADGSDGDGQPVNIAGDGTETTAEAVAREALNVN